MMVKKCLIMLIIVFVLLITTTPAFGFVQPGHCQWWGGTPLRDQNPHLWTGFFGIIILAFALGGGRLLLKKNKGTNQTDAGEQEQILRALEAKEKRLTAKLQELDKRFNMHEITKDDYKRLREQYDSMLTDISAKTQQIKALIETDIESDCNEK